MFSKYIVCLLGALSNTAHAYKPTSEQDAWDNHFSAFGSQNLDQIMTDYTEDSVLKAYEYTKQTLTVAVGLNEIRGFFEGLFKNLTDLSDLGAPVVQVTDTPSQVFLTWYCPSSGVQSATDTFMFNEKFQFTYQYIVWSHGDEDVSYSNATEVQQTAASDVVPIDPEYSQQGVKEAWDNHFVAFGKFDLRAIMQDYTSESVLVAFDHTNGQLVRAEGLAEIQGFFTALFEELDGHLNDLQAPVVNITDIPQDLEKSVYLVWSCKAAGIKSATDTFMFDADNKILRQNIAFTSQNAPIYSSESPYTSKKRPGEGTTDVVAEATSYTISLSIVVSAASVFLYI